MEGKEKEFETPKEYEVVGKQNVVHIPNHGLVDLTKLNEKAAGYFAKHYPNVLRKKDTTPVASKPDKKS